MEIELIYIIVAGCISALNAIVGLITAYKNGRLRSEIRSPETLEKLRVLRENYKKIKEEIKNGRD